MIDFENDSLTIPLECEHCCQLMQLIADGQRSRAGIELVAGDLYDKATGEPITPGECIARMLEQGPLPRPDVRIGLDELHRVLDTGRCPSCGEPVKLGTCTLDVDMIRSAIRYLEAAGAVITWPSQG